MGVKVVSSLRSGHQNAFSHQGLKNLDELASDMSKTVQNDKKRLGPLWVRNLSFLPAFARPRTEFSSVRQEEYLSLIEWYNHSGSLIGWLFPLLHQGKTGSPGAVCLGVLSLTGSFATTQLTGELGRSGRNRDVAPEAEKHHWS